MSASFARRAAQVAMLVVAGSTAAAMALTSAPAPAGVPAVLLSRQLMERAGVHAGDIVTIAGRADGTRATRFRVAGSYEPVPNPAAFTAKHFEARLHLPDLIALAADPGDPQAAQWVNAINLALIDLADANAVSATVHARAPWLMATSTTTPPGKVDAFAILDRFHWAIAVVTIIGSTAFLLALMVMRAEERREIIGVLRLMGVPARSILVEVLLEGLLIAAAGAVFGVVVARAAQDLVNHYFQWRYDTALVFVRVTWAIAGRAIAVAVPLGVLAGLAASWALLRREVVSLVHR